MIAIRRANLDDLPVLVDFNTRLADETEDIKLDEAILEQGLQALFADPSKGRYFVALDRDEIVGCYLITYEWAARKNGTVWWLQSVYVKQIHRKQGVFRTMFEHLKGIVDQDSSVHGLRLYVDQTNVPAQKVYSAMGMIGGHSKIFEYLK